MRDQKRTVVGEKRSKCVFEGEGGGGRQKERRKQIARRPCGKHSIERMDNTYPSKVIREGERFRV